ncbi:MAG: ABC transporter permease, partial [Erysipelotrichaceae bacterium]
AVIASRCGITNLALEGILLFAALFAVIGSWLFDSALGGVIFAILTGVGFSLFLAYFKLKLKADEFMAAIAINLLSTGTTVFILFLVSGSKGNSASLGSKILPTLDIPLIKDIPFIGEVISGHSILVYITIILTFLVNYLLFKTPLGLRIRSVGGNEDAAESVGISVNKTRYIAMMISGVFVGLAGAYMSMSYMSMFTAGMTSGRGFIGLASASVGGNTPLGSLFASLFFGFFDSLGNNLQLFSIPADLIFMIPYIATIIVYTYYTYKRENRKKRMAKKILSESTRMVK